MSFFDRMQQTTDGFYRLAPRALRMDVSDRVEVAGGVWMVCQFSLTGQRTYLTHAEAREFVYLMNEAKQGCYFYRSFAGTGGKQQGIWYPTGGLVMDSQGHPFWIIKGNAVTDPYYGRPGLGRLWEEANHLLPHSDEEMDALILRVTGVERDDFFEPPFELPPLIQILPSHPSPQNRLRSVALQFWKDHALTPQWGPRVDLG